MVINIINTMKGSIPKFASADDRVVARECSNNLFIVEAGSRSGQDLNKS